jgi:hypothetical protein
MSKFTPGPWRIDESLACADNEYHEVEAGNGFFPQGFGLTGYMSIDNCRLIAAAPDMYEALKLILAERPNDYSLGIGRAIDALAKADGKDSQ